MVQVYSFDVSTSEKSSDHWTHQTWKKAFTVPREPADGPEISGGCSYSNKELPDHIKAFIPMHERIIQ